MDVIVLTNKDDVALYRFIEDWDWVDEARKRNHFSTYALYLLLKRKGINTLDELLRIDEQKLKSMREIGEKRRRFIINMVETAKRHNTISDLLKMYYR